MQEFVARGPATMLAFMAVLAIQPGAIGDFVLSLPALRWLRQKFGPGGMEIWAERANLTLVEHPAYADRVRPLAETGLDSYPLPERTRKTLESFDLVVSWRGANFPELVEAIRAAHPRAYFLQQFPPEGQAVHLMEFRRSQLASLFATEFGDGRSFPACPQIFLEESDAEFAREYLAEEIAAGGPIAAIHPGTSSERKRWAATDFAALAMLLQGERGARILLCEGPLDAGAAGEVLAAAPELRARRVRIENLRRLAAVLSRCDLYVGSDSGITHLAAAAGAPTVAIFQATDLRLWAPRGRLVRVLERPSRGDVAGAAEILLKGLHAHAR